MEYISRLLKLFGERPRSSTSVAVGNQHYFIDPSTGRASHPDEIGKRRPSEPYSPLQILRYI